MRPAYGVCLYVPLVQPLNHLANYHETWFWHYTVYPTCFLFPVLSYNVVDTSVL